MKRSLLSMLFAGAMLASSACAAGYGRAYVAVPPPALRYEAVGVAPGPGFVWVGGYWRPSAGRHEWVAGYWGRPPRARAVWIAPRYENRGGRYYFRRGYWR